MPRKIRRNCLVHISGGEKVYRVAIINHEDGVAWHMLAADAKHPDAAKRVPDAFRWYKAKSCGHLRRWRDGLGEDLMRRA